MLRLVVLSLLSCPLIACQPKPQAAASAPAVDSAARDEAAHKAHENYVRVINSNNIDELTSMFTDDVVFLAAGAKPIVGKAAVRAWADDYYKAFKTHWDKPVKEFVISGDYAFERYDYTSTDTPVGGGKPVVDTGWGFVVYHRESDGVWRVARDAFGPDHAPATQ
jgi:ketosteroid isomerase-like protein